MSPERALVVDGIAKSFTGPSVLSGTSFSVRRGEILALLGPSGCGKTTLLRIIAGLECADAGSILLNGRSVESVPAGLRNVAMVFQESSLYPHLSVEENITFVLRIRKCSLRQIRERAESVSALVGVRHLWDRYPHQLSGGESQRVAVARAAVREASLLLLDEPFSNLDVGTRIKLRREFRVLLEKLKVTTVLVTHDQEEALAVGDRLAVLQGGRIVQVGMGMELYNRPATAFVAGFLGNPGMNLIPVRAGEEGRIRVDPAVGKMLGIQSQPAAMFLLASPQGASQGECRGNPRIRRTAWPDLDLA